MLKGYELEQFRKRQEKIQRRKHSREERFRKAAEKGRWVSLPHEPTDSEKILARSLRKAGIPFEPNCWVNRYNVDFLIRQKLIVEVDGSAHYGTWRRDQKRQDRLIRAGFPVLRFSNSQIKENVEEAINRIRSQLKVLGHQSN
jgi:very-short-patch-repair endonuclease